MRIVNWSLDPLLRYPGRLERAGCTLGENGVWTMDSSSSSQRYVRPIVRQDLVDAGLVWDSTTVIVCEFESSTGPSNTENLMEIWSSGNMHAFRPTNVFPAIWMPPGSTIRIIRNGIFSRSHWDILKGMYDAGDLPTPWMYYGTMPLER